jgi:hypothetical protein
MVSAIASKKEAQLLEGAAFQALLTLAHLGDFNFFPEKVTCSEGEINSGILDLNGMHTLKHATTVAQGSSSEKLLCLAKWASQEMKLPVLSKVLTAAAARHIRGTDILPNPVSRYIPYICTSPSELLELLSIYNCLYGTLENGYPRARLPGCLQKGMALALMTYSSKAILSCTSLAQPTFKDLLLSIRGGVLPKRFQRKEGFPLSKEMFEFIVNNQEFEATPPSFPGVILNSEKAASSSFTLQEIETAHTVSDMEEIFKKVFAL